MIFLFQAVKRNLQIQKITYEHFTDFPLSHQIHRGDGAATLRRAHITQTFKNPLDLVGSSIYVAVTVLTESGKKRETVCACMYAFAH